MANQAITSGATSLGASGLNSLLTFFWDSFITVKRNQGNPLQYLNGDISSVVAEEGQNVTVPLYPTITTNLTTDGSTVTQDDSVGSNVTITLNKHRTTKWSFTQVARALDGGKTMEGEFQARLAGMLNDTEADILSMITSSVTTNTVGSYNSAMTEANIVAAMVAYWDNKPPAGLPTALVRHDSNAWGALSQLAAFRDYQVQGVVAPTANDSYMATGLARYGSRWTVTQSLPKSGTSIDNVIFHRNALLYAMRPIPVPLAPGVQAVNFSDGQIMLQMLLQWNGDRLADEFVIHELYGYGVGRQEWAVLFKS